MSVRIERRPAPSRLLMAVTPLLAVALTVVTGFLLFLLLGFDAGRALWEFFVVPVSTLYDLAELGVKAAPLIIIATGLALGFRANVWNIGAEGQLTVGALCAGGLALAFWQQEGVWILPVMVVAGVAGGLAWAAIPAFLKTRFGVNEILVSLMLTYVALLLLSTLVYGPLKDPEGFNFPQSRLFSGSAQLPILLEGTRLHLGVPVALAVALTGWVLLARGFIGFQLRVLGLAPAAARYAGFSRGRLTWFCLLASGGLAGLAGAFEVAGPIGQLVPELTPGYGFTAIIVAFLGRLHPLGIIPAGLLVALSYIGGDNAQISVGLPQAVTGVFQGLLLFFLLASDFLFRYRLRLTAGREARA